MRDISRIHPFLEKFEELWNEHPDMRFGQLVTNVIAVYGNKRRGGCDIPTRRALLWYFEEREWEEAIDLFKEFLKNA